MDSDAKRTTNQNNSMRSTGPTSEAGKAVSRNNNFRHGMRSAHCEHLPTEDPGEIQQEVDKWAASVQPRDDMEIYFNYRNVRNSMDLDRLARIQTVRAARQIEEAASREQAEVERLGRHLFHDRRGHIALYGMMPYGPGDEQTSWSPDVDDPDNPSDLVQKLQATVAGCFWMIQAWTEIFDRLKNNQWLQSHDRLRMARLLGRQPLDILIDKRVAVIFLASYALNPGAARPYADLISDMGKKDLPRFVQRIRQQWGKILEPADTATAGKMLGELIVEAIAALTAKLKEVAEHCEVDAKRNAIDLSFDHSAQGATLRHYEDVKERAYVRELAAIEKHRKGLAAEGGRMKDEGRTRPRRGNGEPSYDDLVAAHLTIDGFCANAANERAAARRAGGCEVGVQEQGVAGVSARPEGAISDGVTHGNQLEEISRLIVQAGENLTSEPRFSELCFSSQVVMGIAAGQENFRITLSSRTSRLSSRNRHRTAQKGEGLEAGSEPITEEGAASGTAELGEGDLVDAGIDERPSGPPFAGHGIDAKVSPSGVEPSIAKKMSSGMKRRARKEQKLREARELDERNIVARDIMASLPHLDLSGSPLFTPQPQLQPPPALADFDVGGS